MPARAHNMMNLMVWPFRSEIWLLVPISLISLIALMLESDYNESEDDVFRNISTLSDDSLAEMLPTAALESKFLFISAILALFGTLFLMTKILQYIFFGKLTETERTNLSEFLFRFVLLRTVILSGVINITRIASVYAWIAWFSVLGLLHACSIVATSRCNQLTAASTVGKTEWIRSMGSVVFLTVASVSLFKVGLIGSHVLSDSQSHEKLQAVTHKFRTTNLGVLKAKFTGGKDLFYDTLGVEVFIAAECLILFLTVIYIFSKLLIELYDRRMVSIGHIWAAHASFTYYADLIYMISSRFVEVAHYAHLLLWSRFFSVASLIVLLHIRFAFASLIHHFNRHVAHIRLMKYIKDNFEAFSVPCVKPKIEKSPAAAEESEPSDSAPTLVDSEQPPEKPVVDLCAVCWEEMHTWRRLPCKHDFHETCLRSWLDQHPTCPTCRCNLGLPSSTGSSNGAGAQEANPNEQQQQQETVLPRLLLQSVTTSRQRINRATGSRGPTTTTAGNATRPSFRLTSRLWNRAFGSRGSAGASATSSSSSSSQQEAPVEEQAELSSGVDENQTRRVPFSIRTHFNRNYFPWINAELSEILHQVLTANHLSASDDAAAAAQDDEFTDDSLPPSDSNHELIYLPQRLRAPAMEISSMLPQFPLSMIVDDLLRTGVPERTVENLLSRPAPSSSSQNTDNQQPEDPVETPIEQQQREPRPDSQTDDNDSETSGGSRSNRLRRILGRARRRFFASGASSSTNTTNNRSE